MSPEVLMSSHGLIVDLTCAWVELIHISHTHIHIGVTEVLMCSCIGICDMYTIE